MMKVTLVLLVATVLISRSTGNPVRDAKQFGGQSFGTVGKVQNCVETGSCQGDNNQGRPAVTGTSNFNEQHFEKVDQVHNCAATGSCQQQGKKKRSIIPQALVESIRSAGNPVRDARQFEGQSFGTVEKVQNCVETGSCQGDDNQRRAAVTGTSNFNKQNFEKVDQVHNCAATGSCQQQGKKKRSIIPQLNTEAFRQSKQFEGQTFNGPVGEINGPNPGPGFEGQIFNGPVGVVNGADQPSGDDFQFPQNLQCNCPDQSRPGSWICIKDEPQCQCQCKPFAVYEPSVMTNMISSSPRQKRQFEGQQFNGPVGEITGSNPGPAFEGQTFNGPVGEINGSNPGPVGVVGGSDQVASQVTTGITSTNPNTNPSASGIAPIEFVNDLGIRYKGNYFNMHLNTI